MACDQRRREQLIRDLARRAAALHLTAPAILFLEMHKPFAFTGAQMLWVAQPLLSPWLNGTTVRDLALLLEDPASVEQLIKQLESARPGYP
ncbi:MAG: hypothetical protein M1482_06790 [Chloroflexi bacterium]|nr:hypothetical protein [Chloroflexota bacterium]